MFNGETQAKAEYNKRKYKLYLVAEKGAVGHVFVGGIKPDGTPEAYGFYPLNKDTGALVETNNLEGYVKDDTALFERALAGDENFRMQVFNVDQTTYQNAMSYIQGYDGINDYGIATNSCVHAAFNTFNHVNLINSYSTNVPFVHPNVIYDYMKRAGR